MRSRNCLDVSPLRATVAPILPKALVGSVNKLPSVPATPTRPQSMPPPRSACEPASIPASRPPPKPELASAYRCIAVCERVGAFANAPGMLRIVVREGLAAANEGKNWPDSVR